MEKERADSRPALPPEQLQGYEAMERLAHTAHSETFLVKSRESGEYFLAKFNRRASSARQDEYTLLRQLDHPAIPKGAAS